MTYLVAIAFLAILASLAAALFFMLRGGQQTPGSKSRGMARALAVRVGLSVLLFLCILLAWKLGYIHPTGIPPGR
ncbi:twin transmembrane helix small protein [uncultured Rhodoferax sp.]|uniref:twin transmembrane helix small protein n=1 Tax=uncultured Rhodoferax sp. TaxID=223188 RepID=UPI0025E7491B|nr:twin transmembrane helix small protein [uncultured Rhodoferax sp.]